MAVWGMRSSSSLLHIPYRCFSVGLGLYLMFSCLSHVYSQEQTFSRQPANTSVVQGQNATLYCEVQNLGGNIVWSKNIHVLGDRRELPSYPRYSMIGDAASAGNLFIQSVELSDDDYYICSVFPVGSHPHITSQPAFLTVQVSPSTHGIDSHEEGELISIQPPATLNLTCRATNGKPAATLTWLKNGEPLLHLTPTVTVETAEDGKLQTAVSTVHLLPEREDNGIKFGCKMEHPALADPTVASVTLNVLFPPLKPLINGYTDGTVLRKNDELRLDCSSRGGNPLAEVYWYKNGERMDYSYITDGVSARNVLPLVIGYGDNNAEFRCEATSIVLEEPMVAKVTLTVQFAPEYVNITGHENMVQAGASLTLKCTTANSNPKAKITWMTNGQPLATHEDVVKEAETGGYITEQSLDIVMAEGVRSKDYICQATNQALHETIHRQITVNVMYPPDPPTITGYTDGTVRAGTLLRMQCYSYGGNPIATLQWYKNSQPLESEKSTGTASATAELTITLEQTDNGAVYQCNASNTATPQPLQANVTLDVLFPPETVNVTANPKVATEGERVVIRCATASSNPVSAISWWRDGIPFGENLAPATVEDGVNGGKVTSSEVVVESLTWRNNGGVYLCRAMNELLEESVNDGLTLDVRYTPIIDTPTGLSVTRREVPGVIKLNCSAHGNPTELTYTWKKNGGAVSVGTKYTLDSEGSLHIQDPVRAEAGTYECTVSNKIGQASITATVNIEYSPRVTTANSLTITLGLDQELACTADANPQPEGFITWSRQGLDISSHTAEFRDGKGILQIQNVTKSDAGVYTCHADNGIEPANEKDINVLIQYKPQIDYSIPNKVAKSTGQTALMRCHAEASPLAKFRWWHRGKEVNLTTGHFTLDNLQHSRYTNDFESRLIIGQVEIFDYGVYICEAYNDLGANRFHINLERTSSPEAPTDLKILAYTHHTVSLNWTAGFDGGLPQAFRVRFNTKDAKQYQYIDVDPPNATYFIMENLNPETYYEFTVRGMNALGDGPYFHGIQTITTKARPIVPTFRPPKLMVGSLPLYAVLLLAFVIIISCMFLNLLLCCCLIKRKCLKSDVKERKRKSEMELVQPESETAKSSPPISESTGSRRGSEDYSYDDSRQYDYGDYRSFDSRYDDEDYRPVPELEHRDTLPAYYNSGYPRKPSYQPSWDDPYRQPGPGSYVSDYSQHSEEPEDMDYADTLRRKQREYPRSATPSPVPSNLGNYVPLPKGGPRPPIMHPSEEGFLV